MWFWDSFCIGSLLDSQGPWTCGRVDAAKQKLGSFSKWAIGWADSRRKMFVHIEKSHDFPVKCACSMCVFVDVKPSAFGFWRQFQKDYVEEKEALAPSKCRDVSCTCLFCRLLKFHTVLGADSRVHCCYIGKHPSPSQSDQQDGYILINGIPSWICSVASWVGDGGGIFSIINCHHTYTYNIRMYIYICFIVYIHICTILWPLSVQTAAKTRPGCLYCSLGAVRDAVGCPIFRHSSADNFWPSTRCSRGARGGWKLWCTLVGWGGGGMSWGSF